MKRHFGSHLHGIYKLLPTIVAQLNENLSFVHRGKRISHDKGSRAYLILKDKNPLLLDTVDCLIRSKLNRLYVRTVSWNSLRFVALDTVPAEIGERCWRGTKEEMHEMVRRIDQEKITKLTSFAPDVEI